MHLQRRRQEISFSTDLSEEQREVAPSKNGSGQSTKCENPNENKERRSDADDQVQGPLEWLEPFTDNLADTENYAPAQVSQDSGSERVTKVAERLRKHNIFIPEDAMAKLHHE